MHIPPPGMVRNSGPHFDQRLNQPVHGPFHFFTPDIKLADHVQEVVSQNSHLEPGLIGLEPLTSGFVPAQGVLAFLAPVFDLCPAIIDLGHLTGWQPGVGHHKTEGKVLCGAT